MFPLFFLFRSLFRSEWSRVLVALKWLVSLLFLFVKIVGDEVTEWSGVVSFWSLIWPPQSLSYTTTWNCDHGSEESPRPLCPYLPTPPPLDVHLGLFGTWPGPTTRVVCGGGGTFPPEGLPTRPVVTRASRRPMTFAPKGMGH